MSKERAFPGYKNNVDSSNDQIRSRRGTPGSPRRRYRIPRVRTRDEEEPPRDRLAAIYRIPEIAQAPSRRQLRSPAKEAANAPSTIGWSQAGARSAIGRSTQPLYRPIRILPRHHIASRQYVKSATRLGFVGTTFFVRESPSDATKRAARLRNSRWDRSHVHREVS